MKGPASASVAADLDLGLLTSGSGAEESGTVWKRLPGALERSAPSCLLVAAPSGGAPVKIEGCAVPVWEALASPGRIVDVVSAVARATGNDESAIADDVEVALIALGDAGIVIRS